jgi:hypothetical protein
MERYGRMGLVGKGTARLGGEGNGRMGMVEKGTE